MFKKVENGSMFLRTKTNFSVVRFKNSDTGEQIPSFPSIETTKRSFFCLINNPFPGFRAHPAMKESTMLNNPEWITKKYIESRECKVYHSTYFLRLTSEKRKKIKTCFEMNELNY